MGHIHLQTDKEIIDNSVGEVTNAKNINLRASKQGKYGKTEEIKGGLYDGEIFGANMACGCGRVQIPSTTPCSVCNQRVYSTKEYLSNTAYFQLTFPVISSLKMKKFLGLLLQRGINVPTHRGSPILARKKLWSTSFIIEECEKEDAILKRGNKFFRLEIIPEINEETDYLNLGAIGLLALKDYTTVDGSDFNFIDNFINRCISIPSPGLRPYSRYKDSSGESKLRIDPMTVRYAALIEFSQRAVSLIDEVAPDPIDKATILYLHHHMVELLMQSNTLLGSGKTEGVRSAVKTRIGRSGRANIVHVPEIDADQVLLPRSLVYEALADDIIEELDDENAEAIYRSGGRKAIEKMEEICAESRAIIIRAPSLHKYNLVGFDIVLSDTDHPVIGLSSDTNGVMNADYDGDQVLFHIIRDKKQVELIDLNMKPGSLWFYEKNEQTLFAPTHELLYGLYAATTIALPKEGVEPVYFEDFESLELAYKEDRVQVDELVNLDDSPTTYGRKKIELITDMELATHIGENEPINTKNIHKIIGGIRREGRAKRLSNLRRFGAEVATIIGLPLIPFSDLYNPDDERVKKIMESKDSTEVKMTKLSQVTSEIIKENMKNLPDNNLETLINGTGRVKLSQLEDMYSAKPIEANGTVEISNKTLYSGMGERTFVSNATYNRSLLRIKKGLTPYAGYNARQLIDAQMHIRIKPDEDYNDKTGITVPARFVKNRIKVDGSVVTESGNELVTVRSMINNPSKYVYRDELDIGYIDRHALTSGSAFGTSMAEGTTEFQTQASLGLKHGGILNYYEEEAIVSELGGKAVTIQTIKGLDFLILDCNGKEFKYLITNNCINLPSENEKIPPKGVIASSKRMDMVYTNAQKFGKMFKFDSTTDFTYSRSSCICYSPFSGRIKYYADRVEIGKQAIPFSEEELYYFPDGAMVDVGTRISSGFLDLKGWSECNQDNTELFACVLKQFNYIFGNKSKDREDWGDNIIELPLLECMFKAIQDHDFSVTKTNKEKKNFMERMMYGHTRSGLEEAINFAEGVDIEVQESFILPLVLGFH